MAGLFETGFLVTEVLLDRLLMTMATPALFLMHAEQLMQHQSAAFNEGRTDSPAVLQTTG